MAASMAVPCEDKHIGVHALQEHFGSTIIRGNGELWISLSSIGDNAYPVTCQLVDDFRNQPLWPFPIDLEQYPRPTYSLETSTAKTISTPSRFTVSSLVPIFGIYQSHSMRKVSPARRRKPNFTADLKLDLIRSQTAQQSGISKLSLSSFFPNLKKEKRQVPLQE